jgi:hypothetical protein
MEGRLCRDDGDDGGDDEDDGDGGRRTVKVHIGSQRDGERKVCCARRNVG